LSFSLVVYRWCGQWVASPSLGSAGPTVKKVAYGVGLVGLVVSACLYIHVGAKYVFVRVLRGTRHLQEGTVVHWVTWLSCTVGLAAIVSCLCVSSLSASSCSSPVCPSSPVLTSPPPPPGIHTRRSDPHLQLPPLPRRRPLLRAPRHLPARLSLALRPPLAHSRLSSAESRLHIPRCADTAGLVLLCRWHVCHGRADSGGVSGWDYW